MKLEEFPIFAKDNSIFSQVPDLDLMGIIENMIARIDLTDEWLTVT